MLSRFIVKKFLILRYILAVWNLFGKENSWTGYKSKFWVKNAEIC